jgi:hypothetical protein
VSSTAGIAERLRERYGTERHHLEDVFDDAPCDLTTFITDKAFLNNPRLSDIQYEAVRHLEQIFLPSIYPDMVEYFGEYWEPVRFINFATLQWGKGSGKDHICRLVSARVAYLLLCLKSPQEYFGQPPQDHIHTLNVAASATQAHRAFFRPLKEMVEKVPCFKDRAQGKEYSIVFDKGIESVSGHSETETQEGLNLILGIADEISAFKTKEEAERHAKTAGGREPAKTAESILKMMRTSARTRFPRNFKLAMISYPRFKGDAIQQLHARAVEDIEKKGPKSRHYYSGPYATWEVNPRISGKEDFEEDYEEDPEMARAMYECKPSTAVNRVFRNDTAVYGAFHDRIEAPVSIEYYWGHDDQPTGAPEGAQEKEGWQVDFIYSDEFVPIRGAVYAIHGDLAITGDRAGVSMAHVRRYEERETQASQGYAVFEPRPIVKVDFVTSFHADLRTEPQPREVQIRWYRKLVWELMTRGFDIALVTFDGFQSTDSIQILESWGLESRKVSTDRDPSIWDNLKDVMYDGRLEAYWRERVVNELRSLQRLPNGKVDHPPGGSKDEADAVAGAVIGAVEMGGDEGESPERADAPSEYINDFSIGRRGMSMELEIGNMDMGFDGDFGTLQL